MHRANLGILSVTTSDKTSVEQLMYEESQKSNNLAQPLVFWIYLRFVGLRHLRRLSQSTVQIRSRRYITPTLFLYQIHAHQQRKPRNRAIQYLGDSLPSRVAEIFLHFFSIRFVSILSWCFLNPFLFPFLRFLFSGFPWNWMLFSV